MTNALQKDELEAEIRTLKTKKASGSDGVTNDMMLHLRPSAMKAILSLFNNYWKSGTVPALWKNATIIHIYKKGKGKKHSSSYRPVSILGCLGKLLERIISTRLMAHLEANNILSPTQSGYRKHRSITSTTRTRNRE